MIGKSSLGSAVGIGGLALAGALAVTFLIPRRLLVPPPAESGSAEVFDALARAAQRSITTGDRTSFLIVADALVASGEGLVAGVALFSADGAEVLRLPEAVSGGAATRVELDGGGHLEVFTRRPSDDASPPLRPVLVGGLAVLAGVLLWLRRSVTGPLVRLRRKLPVLWREPVPGEQLVPRGTAEIRELAGELYRIATTFAEKTRTSQANYLALEVAFEKLHSVLHSLGEGVVVADDGGELVMMNRVAKEILGVGDEDPRGHDVFALLPEPERAQVRDAVHTACEHRATVVVRDIPIGTGVYNVSVAPIRDALGAQQDAEDGGAYSTGDGGVAMVFLDMTQAYELSKLKDDFLSSVSHELRTPLTSIRSFAEILIQMTPEDEENWKEFLGIVSTEAERLTRLVNDVLDLARIEAGKMRFEIEPFEVEAVLRNVAAVFGPIVEEKHGSIQLRVEPNLPCASADRDRFHQVLTNLVGNATKFLPEGGTIRVSAERSGESLYFRVEDSGVGVPEDDWETVFERFHQVGDTLTEKPRGTGLGLSICQQILGHMAGRIWCEYSTALGGAQFVFTLPVSDERARHW